MTFIRSYAVQILGESEFWGLFDRFVDVVFVIDVVVPFFFSYVSSDGKEVVSLRRIAPTSVQGRAGTGGGGSMRKLRESGRACKAESKGSKDKQILLAFSTS